jgi:hypothetical protein
MKSLFLFLLVVVLVGNPVYSQNQFISSGRNSFHKPALNFLKQNHKENRLYIGFGFAKAFRIKDDEFARNNGIRFSVSMGYLFPVYKNLYFNIGLDYNKAELGGYGDNYNFIFSPNYKLFLNKKTMLFLDAGADIVWIFDWGNSQGMQISFTSAVKTEYQITNRFSTGIGLRYLNFFDQRNESYLIFHMNSFITFKF